MIANADVPNIHTTMIDPNLWRLGFQHPTPSRTGVNPGLTTYATAETIGVIATTTVETSETVQETIEMIAVTNASTTIGEGNGVDRNSMNETRNFCKRS